MFPAGRSGRERCLLKGVHGGGGVVLRQRKERRRRRKKRGREVREPRRAFEGRRVGGGGRLRDAV